MPTGLTELPVKALPWAKSICITSGVETMPMIIMIVARIAAGRTGGGDADVAVR